MENYQEVNRARFILGERYKKGQIKKPDYEAGLEAIKRAEYLLDTNLIPTKENRTHSQGN